MDKKHLPQQCHDDFHFDYGGETSELLEVQDFGSNMERMNTLGLGSHVQSTNLDTSMGQQDASLDTNANIQPGCFHFEYEEATHSSSTSDTEASAVNTDETAGKLRTDESDSSADEANRQADVAASNSVGGLRYHSGGNLNGFRTLEFSAGQVVELRVKNVNVLGTMIEIHPNHGKPQRRILIPFLESVFRFDILDDGPISWRFDINSQSDAFIATYEVYSTWIPGDSVAGQKSDHPNSK
ncbi:MAG: hypothetical protein H6739_27865 [Alphaproteobacteria bacterium]|nr:hypothetical protein [Alphaproteobacteria bacterium]